jgi:hypothetical protein
VFDYAAQDQLYKDLHALATANGVAAPVNAPAQVAAPVLEELATTAAPVKELASNTPAKTPAKKKKK